MFSKNSILKNIMTEECGMHSCSIEWKHVFGNAYIIMDIRANNAENLSKYSMEKFHIIRIIDDNEHVESITNISNVLPEHVPLFGPAYVKNLNEFANLFK